MEGQASVGETTPPPTQAMMRRVLMICYYFPPLAGIGSLRALKFATYLPECGWIPVLVAPRNGLEEDPSLTSAGLRTYRTGQFQLGQLTKRIRRLGANASADAKSSQTVGLIPNLVRQWLYRPDGQIGWYPFAVAAGRRAIREGDFDVIFSSSYPMTAHLVARRLHRETGIPWVAEFRDLWSDWRNESPGRQRQDEFIERSILAEATEVVTVSPTYGVVLRARGAKRVSIVTNGFDPVDFPKAAIQDGTIASYVGTYYPERQDLDTALQALVGLGQNGTVPGLRLRLIGNIPGRIYKISSESGVMAFVQRIGFVPHKDALRYICESSVLLLCGPISVERDALRGHIPAKAFEYLGSGRSVLFVGDPASDLAQLLRPFPCVRSVTPGDVKGARDALLSLLQGCDMQEHSKAIPAQLERFTSRSLTGELARTLDRACQ